MATRRDFLVRAPLGAAGLLAACNNPFTGDKGAAARALLDNTELDAESVVRKSLAIAADMCIYTNQNAVIETL